MERAEGLTVNEAQHEYAQPEAEEYRKPAEPGHRSFVDLLRNRMVHSPHES